MTFLQDYQATLRDSIPQKAVLPSVLAKQLLAILHVEPDNQFHAADLLGRG